MSQHYGIQSIPAVKAFKDGKVVDEFVGALPPAQVDRFLDRIAPSEADALVAEGGEANLRRALELEPSRTTPSVALRPPRPPRGGAGAAGQRHRVFAAEGLAARLRLEEDPNLAEAFAAIDRGDVEPGIDTLIAAIPASDGRPARGPAPRRRRHPRRARRRAPRGARARRKLASALY